MKLQKAKITVTGAGGMLGRYICRALVNTGADVRGTVRDLKKTGELKKIGVNPVYADLTNRDSLERAFEGCDAVISNAALYDIFNMNWDDNYRANTTGTENVYGAAKKAGVKRMVQISSFGIYRFTPFETMNELTPQLDGENREGGAYRATKQISDALARKLAASAGIGLTILRPSGIYGAHDRNLMPWVYRALRLPVWLLPPFTFPLVFASDVAAAAVAALENDRAAGHAYNITGEDSPLSEFLHAFSEASGQSRVFSFPGSFGIRADHALASRDLGFRNTDFAVAAREILAEDRPFD